MDKAYLEGCLRGIFPDENRRSDARRVFRLMNRAVESYLISEFLFFASAIVVALVGYWLLAFYCALFGFFIVIKEIRIRGAASKELKEIFEFKHIQFPYWKHIAEELKKFLEKERQFKKGMLPSHVLDGQH